MFATDCDKKLFSLHIANPVNFKMILSDLVNECKLNIVLKDKKADVQKGLEKAVEVAKQNQAKVKELISAVRNGETDQPELKKAIKDATKAKEHLMKYFAK